MTLRPRKLSLSALLPVVTVMVPAALLAVLGWRAHRAESLLLRDQFEKDQAAIVRLVGARLSEEAKKAAQDLIEQTRHRSADHRLESSFITAHPLARHVFVARGGQLLYPAAARVAGLEERERELLADEGTLSSLEADVPRYISRLRSLRRLRSLVARGRRAEYSGRLDEAARYYQRVASRSDPPAARALLGLARVQRLQGRVGAAVATYALLRQRFDSLRDGEGIAFALLADVGQADLARPELLLQIHRGLRDGRYNTSPASRRFYLRWVLDRIGRHSAVAASSRAAAVVARPSPVSPSFAPALVDRIRQRTSALFASDRFGRVLRRYGIADRQIGAEGVSALSIGPRTMLVVQRAGDLLVGYALDEATLRLRVTAQQRKLVTSGRSIHLRLRRPGERVDAEARQQVVHASALDPPLGHWTLVASRSAADPLAALERRGQLRHFAMVAGLIIVLAAGLFFTYRGVRRESELASLKSDFASNVSHELKTPLTSIRMYAEMLQQNIAATPSDQQRYHEVIIRESERLGRLIANVLDFSRVERGTRRYDLRAEDLRDLIDDAVATFGRLTADDQLSVRYAPELVEAEGPAMNGPADPGAAAAQGRSNGGSSPLVTVDRESAIQSVLNLLNNASKYSPDGPEIRVRLLRGHAGWYGVEVADRGIGIPLAEQRRIFDDFYRAPQARQVGVEGTGLGLALVRRHMAAYGGRVEVQSTVGRGSTFTLWFRAAGADETPQEVELGEHTGH